MAVSPTKRDPDGKLRVRRTRIFNANRQSIKPLVINRGGGGSSKSHSIMQLMLSILLTEKNKKILILRKTYPSLRTSVFVLLREIIWQWGIGSRLREVKQDGNIHCDATGSFIHFGSLDDPNKLRSSEWNYIWLEEATEFTLNDFEVLWLRLRAPSSDGRPNQFFFSFNPIDEFHWIKQEIIDKVDPTDPSKKAWEYDEIVSTYKDNPFLPPFAVEQLERTALHNANLYRVMALGEWGILENLIFTNWALDDDLPPNQTCEAKIYGLDFGYNHPTALIRADVKDKENVWVKELLYASSLTNSDLIRELNNLIPPEHKSRPIYADCAEPARIAEIKKAGFNIWPADKGPSSLTDSIDFVKRFNLHITKGSNNLVKELRAYSWKLDKDTGRPVDTPVNFMDDAIAGVRYALWTHFGKKKDYKILMDY